MILLGPPVELNCVSMNEIRDLLHQKRKASEWEEFLLPSPAFRGRLRCAFSLKTSDALMPLGRNGRLWHSTPCAPQSPVWGSGWWKEGAWGGTPPVQIVAA